MKKILKASFGLLLAFCIAATLGGCSGSKQEMNKTQIQQFTTEGSTFKVAVISDTQLPPTEKQLKESDTYVKNLEKALAVIKNNNVDMIIFAGDIGDLGTRFAFQTYMDVFDSVFGNDKPIVQTIMGNHDYWNKSVFTAINHKKAFEEIIGQSPWTHYVVNGYHFIGASPDSGNMTKGYKKTAQWLDNELKKASEDSEGKPIFVITHNQPENTSYGSEDWGDTTLDDVLSKYPNVIDFSGHVHYSLLDERSIWQGDYTVINTQSLSYTEMEEGKENGTIPPNAEDTPMGYIMEIGNEKINIHRINFADGQSGKEEKADMLWQFDLPYNNDGKYSFENRKAANKAPEIPLTGGSAQINDGKVTFTFPAGSDDDFVHSYKIVNSNNEEKLFFSDFYNGIDDMDKTVTLTLEDSKASKGSVYKIYAVDSWGAESNDYMEITVK